MTKTAKVKNPKCKLIGTDGNVFALAGRVGQALKKAGQRDRYTEMCERLPKCESYDAALRLFSEYVEIY